MLEVVDLTVYRSCFYIKICGGYFGLLLNEQDFERDVRWEKKELV